MYTGEYLQNILNGISIGSVYAIFALGYTLVFSILGIINFAHGAVFTLGAYLTYSLAVGHFGIGGLLADMQVPFRLSFPLSLLLGSLLSGVFGVLIERCAFRPLRLRGADPLLALVSSLGVALVTINVIQYLVGSEIYSFPSEVYGDIRPAFTFQRGDTTIVLRTVQLIIFAVNMTVLVLLRYLISCTRVGKALRAVAENSSTASLLGINVDRFILYTFFLSGFLGGMAGGLVGTSFGIAGPYFGVSYGLKGLAVIVLGGLGSIPGAVLGGMVIGLAEAFVPSDYSAYKEAVAFAYLFTMLLICPRGLLGRATIEKV
ncbi:MAG TPA: branched-chain amino acid ABC transporter permease [Desulfuromonadales bacterium]|nr:branched-chain amino acid ABC transporter permease [Desulfuromonadales bacterium]